MITHTDAVSQSTPAGFLPWLPGPVVTAVAAVAVMAGTERERKVPGVFHSVIQ